MTRSDAVSRRMLTPVEGTGIEDRPRDAVGEDGSQSPRRRKAMVALMIAVAVFCSGILAGRWAVKNQVSTRVRQQLASKNGWVSTNTHLFRIETKAIELPDASGWGGGVKALSDGRILYATGNGAFGIIGLDGKARPLGF